MPEKITKTSLPRLFGVFYPTGHVVIAFATDSDAMEAREALLTGGYEEDDVVLFRSDEVIADAEHTRDNIGLLTKFGVEAEAVQRYLELARQGAAFLVIYAPSDAETNRVMNVARRFDIRLAAKYHRFAVEQLLI